MEKIVRQAMLYDFYGELLNSHRRRIYEDAVFGDLSLGEIAECEGISRQGVHDLIRRCDAAMEKYEAKLHLIDKFSGIKTRVERIRELAADDVRPGGVKTDGVKSDGSGRADSAEKNGADDAAGCSGILRLCDEILELL